jgi:PKD repeat protein
MFFDISQSMSINLNVALLTSVFKVLNLRQTKILKCCLWLILILTLSLYAAVSTSHATDQAVIWIDPQEPNVDVGQLFNVTIQIGNLPNLPSPNGAVGFEIGLVWNPTILTGIKLTDVLFHSVTPEDNWDNIWAITNTINNTAGNLKYAYTFQNTFDADEAGYSPITGNHTVAVITFNGTRTGSSRLTFALVKIGDEVHQDVSMPYTTINGTVRVGNPAPEVIISSPIDNTTYNSNNVNLTFTVSKQTDWIGYSIDGHSNVTIQTNTNIQTSDGKHTLIVYANDSGGKMGESDPINFITDTTGPSVGFTYSPQPITAEYVFGNFRWTLNFSAAASTDNASGIASYSWNFGDGTTETVNETVLSVSHVYRAAGTYNVSLNVTDFAGNSKTQTQTITINPASAPINLPLELIVAIVIPVVWVPLLGYYVVKGSRRRKLRKLKR